MKTLNVHETKTRLSSILAEVEQKGETFLICRHGKPVADLTPHAKCNRLLQHPVAGQIEINYDPTEPLESGDWPEEE